MNSFPLNDEHIDGPAPVTNDVVMAEINHAFDIQDRLELDAIDKPTNKHQRRFTSKMNSFPLNDEHIDGPAPVTNDVVMAEINHAFDIQDRLELDAIDKPTNKHQRRFTSKMNSFPLNDEHIDGPAPVTNDVVMAEINHAFDIQDRLELDAIDKPTNKHQRRFTSKVWRNYTFLKEPSPEGLLRYECKKCKQVYNVDSKHSTENFK
ncbi:unnamed protein product [Ilex paraguariensis]|uniref:BED-type domain-containing protein n=1 Tax=Ilex paraguariensis TaxID=185542 RepID=A0ABC8R8E1_9AQUA